jgi:hypothetical protein
MSSSLQTFLFFDALLVAIIVALDWLLSKKQKDAIKEFVFQIWYRTNGLSFRRISMIISRFWISLPLKFFRPRTLLRFLKYGWINIATIPIAVYFISTILLDGYDYGWYSSVGKTEVDIKTGLSATRYAMLVFLCLIVVIRFSFNAFRLDRSTLDRKGGRSLINALLASIVSIAFVLFGTLEWMSAVASYPLSSSLGQAFDHLSNVMSEAARQAAEGAEFDIDIAPMNLDEVERQAHHRAILLRNVSLTVFSFALIPFLTLAACVLASIVSRVIIYIARPVVSLISERIYDDEKSVLSLLAIFIGFVAGLVKVTAEYFQGL